MVNSQRETGKASKKIDKQPQKKAISQDFDFFSSLPSHPSIDSLSRTKNERA